MAVPSAPTNFVVPPVGYASRVTATWTHNSPLPQTAYVIRWRPVGATTWSGEIGTTVNTSATSGIFPPNHVKNPGLEVDASNWESNDLLVTKVPAAFARSTAHAYKGSASLGVTWPTSAPPAGSWVNVKVENLTVGETYRHTCAMYAETGAANVRAEIGLRVGGAYQRLLPGIWSVVGVTYTTDSDFLFVGPAIAASTEGQRAWVDDARFFQVLRPVQYEAQVCTFNSDGASPYSNSTIFRAYGPNIRRRENGSWVPRQRNVRIAGDWRSGVIKEAP